MEADSTGWIMCSGSVAASSAIFPVAFTAPSNDPGQGPILVSLRGWRGVLRPGGGDRGEAVPGRTDDDARPGASGAPIEGNAEPALLH